MINSTQAFLDPIEKWAKAIRQDDFAEARQWAQRLVNEGQMLAQHPDFQRCFTMRSAGSDTSEALRHLCQFLACATEGRARALGLPPAHPSGGAAP